VSEPWQYGTPNSRPLLRPLDACNTGRFGSVASDSATRDTCPFHRHRPNSIHSCLEHGDRTFRTGLPTICKRWWTMRARTSRHSRPNPCRTTPNSIPGTEISLVIGECEQWPPKPVLHRLLSFAQLRFEGFGGGKFPISVGLGAQSTRVQFASLLVGCTTSRTRYG
jgi:hypothetical protein